MRHARAHFSSHLDSLHLWDGSVLCSIELPPPPRRLSRSSASPTPLGGRPNAGRPDCSGQAGTKLIGAIIEAVRLSACAEFHRRAPWDVNKSETPHQVSFSWLGFEGDSMLEASTIVGQADLGGLEPLGACMTRETQHEPFSSLAPCRFCFVASTLRPERLG